MSSLFLYQEWEDGDTELDHEERRKKEGEVENQRERSSRKGDVGISTGKPRRKSERERVTSRSEEAERLGRNKCEGERVGERERKEERASEISCLV